MQDLTIALVQSDLHWEDPEKNHEHFFRKLSVFDTTVDLIVLPEMFSTGFSMHVEKLAEEVGGKTMNLMATMAREKNCVVAGSVLIHEKGRYFNRFIWMKPDGSYDHYDKRHLFSMAGEDTIMTGGDKNSIVTLKGWKVALQVCYDLRFPVWSRNVYSDTEFAYDLLVYVANWPEERREAYRRLLPARAIENQSYVAWVNRVGSDGRQVMHTGDSAVYDPLGTILVQAKKGLEQIVTTTLSYDELQKIRSKFKFAPDWDSFTIE